MRDLLTGLAILLIIALSVALAGPYFVDWNSRRGEIEARISNYVGAPVTVRVPIALKLLPTPRLRLGDVQAVTPGDGPKLGVRQVVVEVSVMPLLRGDVLVTEALLDGA
ncbi:AsmA family protein, partial [Nostoc sp. NIES-2111]